MKNYFEKARDIYEMLANGKLLEAFDKYYHEDVVMQEANGDSRKGKAVNREYEVKFLDSVKEFHGMGVNAITSNEEDKITMVESWMDVTMKDGTRAKMEEVCVQRWQGDQIIHERFYYNMPA